MAVEAAIRCGTIERGYPQVQARVAQLAGGLHAAGVGPDDNVALVLRNSVEFIELSAAAALCGANPVPVNWHWKGGELGHLLADSDSRLVFAHSEFASTVAPVLAEGVPLIEVVAPDGQPAGLGPELESWREAHQPLATPQGRLAVGVIYTSGTTGRPKGIVREPVDAETYLRLAAAGIERLGLRPGGRTLVPAPLYHTAPNVLAMTAFAIGMDITVMERFDPEQFLRYVERHRIEQVQMVPTMFIRLLRLPEEVRSRYDLSSLRRVLHSAAPCPPQVKERIVDWFGPIVVEYYGGSETGAVVWCDSAEWLAHRGTVGRPADGGAVRILDADGAATPTGEVGLIYLRPADYWPDFTYRGDDAKRRAIEADGFVTVGDLGRLDEDGYLYLTDRASDMAISGGVNIYPAEIEMVLSDLDGVEDSAVFGIPDEEFGEVLAVHVQTDPAAGLTEDAVREYVRARLTGYKVPRVVVFTDELPREESGKLFKRQLREPYWTEGPKL